MAALLLLPGCQRPAEPPSVLLLVVDTLRADSIGASSAADGGASLTPVLDRWSAGASLFRRASAPAPFTMPSMASVLTGVYPDRTGVITHEPGITLDAWTGQTLAEAAREAGMATAAVVANPWLVRERTGFARGFDRFSRRYQRPAGGAPASARDVTDEAIRLLGESGDRRFFLWVHYFDPHMPYRPPPQHAIAAGAPAGPSRVMTDFRAKGRDLGRIYRGEGYSEAELEHARRLYDGEVRYTDEEIGRLLEHLRSSGRLGKTLVVLVSDHGESLGEHGLYFAHDFTLYEELLNVALAMRGPGVPAERRDDDVSLLDVAPTVCRLAGLPCRGPFDGRDLLEGPRGGRTLFAASTTLRRRGTPFARLEVRGPGGRWKMARRDGWKLVRIPTRDGEERELYDLGADPAELRNLASSSPQKADALAKELDRWSSDMDAARPRPAEDQETPAGRERDLRTLRSLGYLQ